MSYQTTSQKRGDSNFISKWNALELTESHLAGKSVLDLGCNDGFFCIKCLEKKATKVVGVNKINEKSTIDTHLQRKENVKYYCMDWDQLINTFEPESFDVVLLLSAMHYESGPQHILPNGTNQIMNIIQTLLKKGGLFVFEGGIIVAQNKKEWVRVRRTKDVVYHPTQLQFESAAHILFDKVELIGKSINQIGDVVDRYVYHCYK